MMRLVPGIVATLALLAATVGCSSTDSEDLETSGMNAAMEVRRGNDGSDVTVSLSAGTLNYVSLNNADQLTATAGEETVTLAESNVLSVITYSARLAAHEAGDEVTIALTREDKESAPSSTVVLPATVEITSPAAGTEFSRANQVIVVDLTGEESEDEVELQWSGDCITTDSLTVPAGQTSVTIGQNVIEKKPQTDANDPDSEPVPDQCQMLLTVSRRVTGSLDGAFQGGAITAITTSSRDLISKP